MVYNRSFERRLKHYCRYLLHVYHPFLLGNAFVLNASYLY